MSWESAAAYSADHSECDRVNYERSTHASCSAQGQMVHLLCDRAHHAGRLHGHRVVHGWRDDCTLVEETEKS